MAASKEAIKLAEEFNRICKEADDKRDEGLNKQPDNIQRIDDIQYGKDNQYNLLDIYLPKERKDKVPVIFNFHGGGFVYGTKETYQFYGMHLASYGFGFVNISYRLAPKVEFPEELDDINEAIHFVVKNAEKYGLDLNNVFFVGDSAGGNMALQYLTILSNDKFRSLFGYEKPIITVRAAALNCGGFFMDDRLARQGAINAYFTDQAVEKHSELMKTEEYITKDIAPLLVMTSSHDFIRDLSVKLHGYLSAKDVYHEFYSYGDQENPLYHVFHCDIKNPEAIKCNKDQIEFFRKFIEN